MRHLIRIAASLALLATGSALAETSYYRGHIGDEPWQLELSIDGNAVLGRLVHDHLPLTYEAGGSFEETENRVVARFGLAEGELSGTLIGEPDQTGTFEGTFLASGTVTPFSFEKVAQYVDYTFQQGLIQATSTYPFFSSPRLQDMNDFVQPDLMADQIEFIQTSQEAELNGDIRNGWWFDSRARIEYAAPGLLSTLVTVSDYTGGAHPSLNFWSYNLALTGTRLRPFDLADLFLADSGWLEDVSSLVLAELEEQQAAWVLDGSVSDLSAKDLQVFVISPNGLQFILAPYLVGPWVEGAFTVVLPLESLDGLLDPQGPVRLFSPASPETDQ